MEPDDRTLTNVRLAGGPLPSHAGKYRIVGHIGQGGMGVVFRAVDDDLGRQVALKFIPPHLASDDEMEQRFLREARAASALDHVNIGTIFGVEETADNRRFIVMAYYEGQNLVERQNDASKPLESDEALSIAIQVARGLAEAHSRGVIHRDIKPSNVLITTQGVVKIVDFGLASMADADQLTLTGARMGTPAYMSPEQAMGETADHRSDIWSLGVVLCEMLTRQQAFGSNSIPAILFKVVHGALPSLDSLDPALQAVLRKALERDPARRYQSMAEFCAGLEALGPAHFRAQTSARPIEGRYLLVRHLRRPWGSLSRRRRAIFATLFAAVVLCAGALVWKGLFAVPATPPAGAATPVATAYDKYLQGVELVKRWDKADNLEKAIGLFAESTKLDPEFALGFARLADAQRIRYALSHDKAHLDDAIRNSEHAASLNPSLAPVQIALGRILAARGKNDLAFAAFENALRIDGNDPEAHQAVARQYERLGRLKDAEAAYDRALSLDPESISIHDAYANFLFRQSRHDDAVREWQTVVRLTPDNASALVNLGSSLNETGRIAEAITMFQRAVELKPSYMAFTNLGTAYSRAKRYQDASAAYKEALKLNDKDHMVWGNLAFVYSWIGGMDSLASQTFEHAIGLAEVRRRESPRDAFTNSDLALYYAKTRKPELASLRLKTALALAPDVPEIQAAAAEVSELIGEREKGVAFARKAVLLGYSNQRLQRNPELSDLLRDPRFRSLQ